MIETKSNLPIKRHLTAADDQSGFISYEDLKSMHILDALELRSDRWTPPFCWNTRQLQRVLLIRAWRWGFGSKPLPAVLPPFALVDAAATARSLRGANVKKDDPKQKAMVESARAAVRRAGTYTALQAAIAFRCWRLGQDSPTVGESLGITPQAVRASLQKIKDVAAELGYDVGEKHPTKGRKRK